MRLSRRLECLIDMTGGGRVAADIGTDHGFVPVELVRRGRYERALAADVRPEPLARAEEHVREAGLSDRIELRLADGLAALEPGEADTIIIAGMGGILMESILRAAPETAGSARELVLSPHSDWGSFRRYLLSAGFTVDREDMLEEAGKYYIFLHCRPSADERKWEPWELEYGKSLTGAAHPVLRKYLEGRIRLLGELEQRLNAAGTSASRARLGEIRREYSLARQAQQMMDC